MYNGKNFVIGVIELEIFYKDLPAGKSFNQYNSLCLALKGDGWRLPTLNELSYMYGLHNLGVLNFSGGIYWSSTRATEYGGMVIMLKKSFIDGKVSTASAGLTAPLARPVRSIIL